MFCTPTILRTTVCLAVFLACIALPARQANAKDMLTVTQANAPLSKALDAAIDGAIARKRMVRGVVLVSYDGRFYTTGQPDMPTGKRKPLCGKIPFSVWLR